MIAKGLHAQCDRCPLRHKDNTPVGSFGSKDPKFIIVGEGPGAVEGLKRIPFVGPSGEVLRDMISSLGIDDKADILYTNATLCVPKKFKGNKEDALETAVVMCRRRLYTLLSKFPGVPVLALGKFANAALGIRIMDRWEYSKEADRWVMGTIHPAYLFHNPTSAINLKMALAKFFRGWEKGTRYPDGPPHPTLVRGYADLPPLDSFADHGPICVDVEANTTDWWNPDARVILVGIAWWDFEIDNVKMLVILPKALEDPAVRHWLSNLYSAHKKQIGGHNYKFDTLIQYNCLGTPTGVGWDTMLMANILHEHWYKDLKSLVTYYFNVDDYANRLVHNWLDWKFKKAADRTFDKVPIGRLVRYLSYDIYYNLLLCTVLTGDLAIEGRFDRPYKRFEIPLSNTLVNVEKRGIRVDMEQVEDERDRLKQDILEIVDEVQARSDGKIEKPGSYKQIKDYLFRDQRIPFPRGTGKPEGSTADPVLEKLTKVHPVVTSIQRYRRVSKLKTSYLDNIRTMVVRDQYGNWLCFPSYKQAHVLTGRLSARRPAIQTIPKKNERKDGDKDYGKRIKLIYTARPGYVLVAVDGSQWELRVATAWSEDPYLVDIYQRGIDFHGAMCDLLYGPGWTTAMRTIEKNIVFGLLYGGHLLSLVSVAHISDEAKARVMHVFETKLRRLIDWRDEMFEIAQRDGVIVSPYFNRAFHFDFVHSGNLRDIQKYSVNYPTQGTASNITLEAGVKVGDHLRESYGAYLLMAVHDELIIETPINRVREVVQDTRWALETVGEAAFPIIPWKAEADLGYTWGNMVELYI